MSSMIQPYERLGYREVSPDEDGVQMSSTSQ
jgi:hypothetical protein